MTATPDRPAELRAMPAPTRRERLAAPIDSAPMRALASDAGIRVVNCPACRHNGYRDMHVIAWADVTVKLTHAARPNGERWLATYTDPNIPWVEHGAGLTDEQVAIGFAAGLQAEGVDPAFVAAVVADECLDSLDDACMFDALFRGRVEGPEDAA
jgi:hypothetical protein